MDSLKRRWTFFISAALVAALGGCALKKPERSEAYVVVMKTPQWRFADTGYVRVGDGVAELEVFEAGHRVLRLQIKNLVCVEGEGCLSKAAFNARYLSETYPDDLFFHLLRGEPIMSSEALVRTDEGFEQHIGGILYRVGADGVYFHDSEHRIVIKFKPLY